MIRSRLKNWPKGASWKKPNWPQTPRNDLVSALDGNWAEVEKAVADKLKGKADQGGKGAAVSQADIQRSDARLWCAR
jgi:2-oxoglutarate dehydrogenase E1 component